MSARRLNIAFFVGKFPAISETFILNQITGLIDAGHYVDIFAKDYPSDEKMQAEVDAYRLLERTHYFKAPNSRIARWWKSAGVMGKMVKDRNLKPMQTLNLRSYQGLASSFRMLSMLYPLLEGKPYDIIHCHFGPLGLYGLQLKEMGMPGKLLVAFHGHDISKFLTSKGDEVYQRIFEKADLLLPVSAFWKYRLRELGADPERIRVQRMGIDLNAFPFQARSLKGTKQIRLLTVGRLVEKKGIPFALQAIARLLARHPDWEICYNVIGSGIQEDYLQQLIEQLGLRENVFLLGQKTSEEINQYMMDSHLFLLPSVKDADGDQEGIPVSLMEAMAAGMPILSTLHTGIPELVKHGRSGYLVPEGNVEALCVGLESLILHADHWPEMGRNGRRYVEANHNIHTLIPQLIDIYYDVLAETPETVPVA